MQRLLSPTSQYEDPSCIPLAAIPPTATWSQNSRLSVGGHAITLVAFGAIQSLLWYCEKDKPPVLKITIELLTNSDKAALQMVRRLGNEQGIVNHCMSM